MRIFNQLRKVLLKEGKIKDYLIYAIGEIVLVVIGILIALNINNWNEQNKIDKERLLTLEILKQSFEKNKVEIEATLDEYDTSLKFTNLRIKNTGPQIQNVSEAIIDSIRIIDIVKLELANNLSSNILIDNKNSTLLSGELRNLLLQYTSVYSKYKNTEDNTVLIALKLRENHQKHIALFGEVTASNTLEILPHNRFNSDYIDWFRDRENQNLSVELKWKLEQSILELKSLSEVNESVLDLLIREINNN